MHVRSRPPRKPGHAGLQSGPQNGRQHLLLGSPKATWVCRAALKPGEPSTPQLSQGTQLSRTTESGNLMPVLSTSRANAKAWEAAALWRKRCTLPLFTQPVKSEQQHLLRGLTMPFCAAGAQPGPAEPGRMDDRRQAPLSLSHPGTEGQRPGIQRQGTATVPLTSPTPRRG